MPDFNGVRVGFGITGSFCTHKKVLQVLEDLVARGADVTPILSFSSASISSRFLPKEELWERLASLTGKTPLSSIEEVEPIGPKKLLDVMAVVPCTGNSLGKMACGITDSPVLMACKSHLRNNRPVVLAVSTNDGLSGSAQNLGTLLSRKNFFFVPFGQDDAHGKPFSLVADFGLLSETLSEALQGRQIQPVLLSPR